MRSMKNVAVFTEDGAFALFFRPHPGGFDSSRVPTPGNLPSKAKNMLMPRGQPGGALGAAGIDWCITKLQDCDGNGNVKKAIGLVCKTTTLHVYYAFLYISLQSLRNYEVKWQILSLLGNGNGKAINSAIFVRTRARSLLFSSNPNFLLLSYWAPRNNREKSVYFSAMFS